MQVYQMYNPTNVQNTLMPFGVNNLQPMYADTMNLNIPTQNIATEDEAVSTTPSLDSMLDMFNEGDVLDYLGGKYRKQNGKWVDADTPLPKEGTPFDLSEFQQFLNPMSTNLQTDFYNLGRFLGTPKGTQGRGLGIASSLTSSLLGSVRTGLSGYANSVATNRTATNAREQMARRLYTPQTQLNNQNNTGLE